MFSQRLVYCTITLAASSLVKSDDLPPQCYFPSDPGPCRAIMPRWYFNSNKNRCEQFNFGGCQGNENNFASQTACDTQCTDFLPHQLQDSDSDSNDYARNFDLFDSPCHDDPKITGRCRAALSRWSWNQETLQCEEFTYGGCEGNENNFRSLRKCNRECEHLAIVAKNFYDDVLSIEEEEEEEEEPEPEETEEERKVRVCALGSEQGPCRARFDRFYYDSTSNSCKKFTFGGCEGNENNFQAKGDCQELCVNDMLSDYTGGEDEEGEDLPDIPTESASDECDLPATSGFCRGFFTRWHWNTDAGKCETFVWGGCGGNANNFETEEACQQKCQSPQERSMVYDFVDDDEEDEEGEGGNAWDNLFGGGDQGGSDDLIDPCDLSIQRGPCRALYPKWAFDGENCVSFMYGGCMGNANNFGSMQECRKTCQDELHSEEEGSESNNGMVNDFTGGSDSEDDEENFAAIFPECTTTGEGKFDQISYSSKMTCTSLGNSHHSGDPETEFLSIDGLTDAPSADRVKTFVERFPKLKVLVLNGLELNERLNIQLPGSLKIFISKNSGWTKISEDTFLRAGALRKINLSGNLIQRLTANQFRSQKYLMKVDLSDNLIGQIPDGLFTSSKRQFCDLILDGNDIEGFSRRTFYGLRKLKKLSVKENPLSQGLEDFLFSQNPILKCVLLTDSGIDKLGKNVFSSSKNPKLRQVDLSGADNMPKYLRKDWDTKKKVWEKLMMKL